MNYTNIYIHIIVVPYVRTDDMYLSYLSISSSVIRLVFMYITIKRIIYFIISSRSANN